MPTHQRLGPDNRENLQDRRPAIQMDKEPTIIVREPDATMHSTPQDDQLMSKHRVSASSRNFDLNGKARTARTKQPDHSTSLGDSVTSSTRMRF
jgi:hypothetical protein